MAPSPKPPLHRLKKRAQFLYVRAGARAARGAVLVEARKRADGGIGIGAGFTASKKIGDAVTRNRARRRLKEAARQLLPAHGLPGADYVLVARRSTPDAPWPALLDDLKSALIRLRADLEAGPRAARPPKRSSESD